MFNRQITSHFDSDEPTEDPGPASTAAPDPTDAPDEEAMDDEDEGAMEEGTVPIPAPFVFTPLIGVPPAEV